MTLPFADSAQSTLGIEWELALVDAVSGELRSEAPDLLRALHVTEGLADDDVNPHMTSELLQNTVELVTGVHERVDAATADLGRIAARVEASEVSATATVVINALAAILVIVLALLSASVIAIGLFYGAGFAYGERTHLSVMEYWRWWVVHLWVEGFFEVFAVAVIAFLFTRLGLLQVKTATMAVLFAATTMDSGVRLQRLVVTEIGELMGVKLSGVVATVIAVGCALGLTFSTGVDGSGGMLIWPLFGTTNQLMAGLTLSILVIMLTQLRRPTWPVLIPLVFVTVMSLWAAVLQLRTLWSAQNWLLLVIDVVIIGCAIWVIVEAITAISKARREPAVTWRDDETMPGELADVRAR